MQEILFGRLLKKYKQSSALEDLVIFAEALADEGLVYSVGVLSSWQRGLDLPKSRKVFIVMLKVLIAYGAVNNVYQANRFLVAANKRGLSSKEVKELLIDDDFYFGMNLYQVN